MKLDWPGALLIAVSLGCLQLFVERLPKHGVSASALGLLGVSVASAWALWNWEKRFPQPILPVDMFRNKSLAALFTLAVLGGFTMFSLLFYAPLLFQGGFGMSPKEAGLVITPLVVFITIGSIANGRLVSRLRNPNLMLYIGFSLLAVACLGVVIATRSMPRELLMTFMILGGLGLGFVMPNLTIFAQQTAGREHLGIATALLQSLRMIGGMIGTALTGTLIGHMYASGVRSALERASATQWFVDLSDPQILINRDAQSTLVSQLSHTGHDGALLLEAAREALVASIHMGLALAAVVAVVSVWQSRRVPSIKLQRRIEPVVHAD
jgi:predicted MFS family arabinose efflux permease